MAFALTGYTARGIDIAGPNLKRGIQQVVMQVTALAADVDLDIGDTSGTFWTAAVANTTYGELASKARESLTRISTNAVGVLAVKSPQLLDRVQVATLAGAGEYTLALAALGPNLAFDAADGETSYYIVMEYELNDRIFPEITKLGA